MLKGWAIGLTCCMLAMVLLVPVMIIAGVVLYESKTAEGPDFLLVNTTKESSITGDVWTYKYSYTFHDIGPGELKFDIKYDNNFGGLVAEVFDEDGNLIKRMDGDYRFSIFRPNYYIVNSTKIDEKGDYTVNVTVRDQNYPDMFDTDRVYIEVTFKGGNNGWATGAFCCSFTSILLASLLFWSALVTWIVFFVRKRKG